MIQLLIIMIIIKFDILNCFMIVRKCHTLCIGLKSNATLFMNIIYNKI